LIKAAALGSLFMYTLSVSVSPETYIRKDTGFENSASTARSELGRIGSAPEKGVRGTVPAGKPSSTGDFAASPASKSRS
jgi:hypothetical protein